MLVAGGIGRIDPVGGQGNNQLEVSLSSLRDDKVQVLEGRLVVSAGASLQLVVGADTIGECADHRQVVCLCSVDSSSVSNFQSFLRIDGHHAPN